jgi:hypothetical protein
MGNMNHILSTFLDVVLGLLYICLFLFGWRAVLGTSESRRSPLRPPTAPR